MKVGKQYINKLRSLRQKQKPLKKQNRVLRVENTVTKLEHPIQSFHNRLDQTEEGISEWKNRSYATIQSDEEKEKRMKNSKKAFVNYGTLLKETT